MKKEAKPNTFWSVPNRCRDVCKEVSILDELKEDKLRQLHTQIKQQTAVNLNVTAYLGEISRKLTIDEHKYDQLVRLVGKQAAPDYLTLGAYKVMSNMGIINTRIMDT